MQWSILSYHFFLLVCLKNILSFIYWMDIWFKEETYFLWKSEKNEESKPSRCSNTSIDVRRTLRSLFKRVGFFLIHRSAGHIIFFHILHWWTSYYVFHGWASAFPTLVWFIIWDPAFFALPEFNVVWQKSIHWFKMRPHNFSLFSWGSWWFFYASLLSVIGFPQFFEFIFTFMSYKKKDNSYKFGVNKYKTCYSGFYWQNSI